MHGDRWANEFWYQFNEETELAASSQLLDAYQVIASHTGGSIRGLRDRWLSLSRLPGYPQNFISFVTPLAGPLEIVSSVQLKVIDRFYPCKSEGITAAFAFFGEGVLYDPRQTDIGHEVHTMDDLADYHTWHAFQRAMMFLGINRHRWEELARLTAFAWAVQSVAMPGQRVVNPPLPASVLNRLASTWLCLDQRELDEAFQSVPRPKHLYPGSNIGRYAP
ncbi:hypothetical protein ABZZ74_48640 [Streptomyces sp. NPDC006476]|uniref:hypothetical protein n=1 Tax=Streptomyces sp. NPDC006476 TaxID=3157175 RepID=UPI0033AD5CBE